MRVDKSVIVYQSVCSVGSDVRMGVVTPVVLEGMSARRWE